MSPSIEFKRQKDELAVAFNLKCHSALLGLGAIASFHRSVAGHYHLHDALRHALHQRFDGAVHLLQGVDSSSRVLCVG